MPAALGVLCYVLFFHQLGGIGLMGPDEPRYAGVARGMYTSGDYITPRLDGENWFEKPVLMYWLAAAGFAVVGVGETAARLPSALGAASSVFLLYWSGRRVFGRAVGFAAAVITATSVGFFALARAASMDMPLTAALTAALAFLVVALEAEGARRRACFYAFYAALGFGLLAKGPVAVLLPALAVGTFVLARRGWGEWRRWHPEGILATVLVAGPWYGAVTWIHGREFIDVFVLNHNLQRFTSEVHGHPQPFYFYAPVLLLLFFPWSFLLVSAVRRRSSAAELLLLLWAAAPLAFFSLSGSKLPAYILPSLPPLALLTAREIARSDATFGYRAAVWLQAALWLALGVTFGFFGDVLNFDLQVDGLVALAPALVLAAALAATARWFPPRVFGAVNAVSMAVLVTAITAVVFPRVQSMESMRPWNEELDRLVADGADVILYRPEPWMEYGFQYYRGAAPIVAASPEELAALTADGSRTLSIAAGPRLEELGDNDTVLVEVVSTVGGQFAFWVWHP